MNKQSAEDYLDELLNSVNGEKKYNEPVKVEENIEKDIEKNVVTRNTARAEAEFLMEFERELAGEDFEDFLKDFEENDIQPEDRLENSDMNITEEDALISMLGADVEEIFEPEPLMETTGSVVEEINLEELALSGIEIEEIGMGDTTEEEPDLSEDSGVGPMEAIDLSQLGEEDLISLLAGTDDLADIGELLSQNDSEIPIDSEDPFASFATNEMAGQMDSANVRKESVKSAESAKKGGFLQKLSNLLFGKDGEEVKAPVSLATDSMPSAEQLSDENADILAVFAEADKAVAAEKSKGKKEKKKKEPKAKTPPKPKAPKKPKVKKPKVKDNTPPLPKGPVALVCLLAVSIFVLIYWGTDLISYSSAMSKAKELYKLGQYSDAAEVIAGMTIKEEDMMIQGKISTLAAVHSQISEYDVFMNSERKAEALDSLISAAGRIVVNEENSLTFDCADEMKMLKNRITRELEDGFNMTYEEALELYSLTERDRAEYTRELYKIYEELGIIIE